MLTNFGVKVKSTTEKNPTANEICEQMHHTVGDILRAIKYNIANEDESEQAVDNALYTACSDSSSSAILYLIALRISPTM